MAIGRSLEIEDRRYRCGYFPDTTNTVLAVVAYLGNTALAKKLPDEGEAGETWDPLPDDPCICATRGGHYDTLRSFLDR